MSTVTSTSVDAVTAWITISSTRTSSRSRCITPASKPGDLQQVLHQLAEALDVGGP
jgi:hypothetical protein